MWMTGSLASPRDGLPRAGGAGRRVWRRSSVRRRRDGPGPVRSGPGGRVRSGALGAARRAAARRHGRRRAVGGLPPGNPDHPVGLGSSWKYHGGDEFNGDALARRMWQPDGTGRDVGGDAPFKQDKEAAWFATSNVTVSGGDLVPTIRNQAKELDGKRYPLSSGVVQRTSDQRLEPSSYVEARISVSDCDGCWPAFWQVPFDQWPPEIDTLEYFDTAGQNRPGLQLLRAGPRPVGAHPLRRGRRRLPLRVPRLRAAVGRHEGRSFSGRPPPTRPPVRRTR